jgi:hypothetical protein
MAPFAAASDSRRKSYRYKPFGKYSHCAIRIINWINGKGALGRKFLIRLQIKSNLNLG